MRLVLKMILISWEPIKSTLGQISPMASASAQMTLKSSKVVTSVPNENEKRPPNI